MWDAIDLRKIQEQLMLFFSLPKSSIIQRHFSAILVKKHTSKMNSIPFTGTRYRFATSDPVKALETLADHWQNNQRLHIVQEITKNVTTLHNLPKSIHKIPLMPYLENKKSDPRLINLPFAWAVKNTTQTQSSTNWNLTLKSPKSIFRPSFA